MDLKNRLNKGLQVQANFSHWFNTHYKDKYELVPFNQAYGHFDYWMIGPELNKPMIVEIKSRPSISAFTYETTKIDYFKLLSLRQFADNHRAYCFIIFKDKTLIIDLKDDPDYYVFEQVHGGEQQKLIAEYKVENLKEMPIGTDNLLAKLV